MNDASAIGLYYDSWDTTFKNPFGAVQIGSEIRFNISYELAHSEFINRIELELIHKETKSFIDMKKSEDYYFISQTFDEKGVYFYRFAVYYNEHRYYLAPDTVVNGGIALLYRAEDTPHYQLTIHTQIEKVPEFYSEGIIYQIFADRFCNGNENGLLLDHKKNSFIYSDWSDTPQYIKHKDGNISRWDFYGGNLLGVIKKLDYLKELGVTCIYFNPIFQARSCHKYDTADYMKIDSMFGDEEIFKELIDKAKERNIYIILDGVFSHTGSDSIYFNRYGTFEEKGAYQSKTSKYYQWYKFKDYPDSYEAWWGIGDLPNVNEMEPSYLDFITGENGVIAKWMNLGVKGFRLDVADELPEDFIRAIRKRMKSIDKDSVLLGEVWEDATNKISYGERREYMLGESLDSVTSYPFRRAVFNFIKGELDSKGFYDISMSFKENYPQEYYKSALKLIGSHDVKRAITELETEENFRMAITIQLLFLGPVLIYYGDEVGIPGDSDPYNRASYPWDEYWHLGKKYSFPDGNPLKNNSIYQHYKLILDIRQNNSIITKGKVRYLPITDHVMAIRRYDDKDEIIIVANSSDSQENIVIEASGKSYMDLMDKRITDTIGEKLSIEIQPKCCMVLKKLL